jgi:hypothetical protein
VLLHDNAVNVAVLDALSDRGVSIALDDLNRIPVAQLPATLLRLIKIDHLHSRHHP